ncbi:uncharacterized protein DDB_G0287625 [Bactrocera neohumeralis]|uniref:uncharacterized protein DDB_G0287625 n=1 Tax=Bactrocera neohumeralis TaxID=98809 RepID=UPI002166B80B|nr:uncharacterized protein DDB_G0287625 [Bactrocera neohumeralis]
MLNGKFYTGLPPGMIERGATQRNRLQSSIFWPDDTKVDSAVETRVKRRNSLQIAQAERPRLRMQSSVSGGGGGDADINTRQLFQKEFSKSSIEFLDNLCDETKARKPLLFRGHRSAASEVTAKPTALRLPLPENVVNAGYTTAKKKQAFTSKIEFYDYVGDELNNRNNLRRAKMDMNDKKEMERNTKNSPKLQVKNNMRDLSAKEKLYPAERREKVELEKVSSKNVQDNTEIELKNNMRAETENRAQDRYATEVFDEEYEGVRYNSAGNRRNPRASVDRFRDERIRELDFLESRRTVSPEHGYRREHRLQELYEDEYGASDYAPTGRYGRVTAVRRSNSVGRFTTPPKRILKQPIRERRHYEDYADDGYRSSDINRGNAPYRRRNNEVYERQAYNEHDAEENVDYMEDRMRNMRVRTSPKKHVTYSDDTYSHDDEMPTQSRRTLASNAQSRDRAPPSIKTAANMRTGSNNLQRQQPALRRYNSEIDIADDANVETLEPEFVENDMSGSAATIKSLNIAGTYNNKSNNHQCIEGEEHKRVVNKINNNKNNNYNNTSSRLNNQTIASAARKITPNMPTAVTTKQNTDTRSATPEAAAGAGVKKHLRSSLCFNNGEIIASDDGGSTSVKAPTRNARSTATRQRISVGLPD